MRSPVIVGESELRQPHRLHHHIFNLCPDLDFAAFRTSLLLLSCCIVSAIHEIPIPVLPITTTTEDASSLSSRRFVN